MRYAGASASPHEKCHRLPHQYSSAADDVAEHFTSILRPDKDWPLSLTPPRHERLSTNYRLIPRAYSYSFGPEFAVIVYNYLPDAIYEAPARGYPPQLRLMLHVLLMPFH